MQEVHDLQSHSKGGGEAYSGSNPGVILLSVCTLLWGYFLGNSGVTMTYVRMAPIVVMCHA